MLGYTHVKCITQYKYKVYKVLNITQSSTKLHQHVVYFCFRERESRPVAYHCDLMTQFTKRYILWLQEL